MGFFGWLGSLFGKKKSKIPEKVVEYRSGREKRATAPRAPYERSYVSSKASEGKQAAAGNGRDLFELAGDRAAKRKDDEEHAAQAARADASPSAPEPEPAVAAAPEPEPEPEPVTSAYAPYTSEQPQAAPTFESEQTHEEPPQEPEPAVAAAPEYDYSPLDFAREIRSQTATEPQPAPAAPDAVTEPDGAAELETRVAAEPELVIELGDSKGSAEDEIASLGVKFEPGFGGSDQVREAYTPVLQEAGDEAAVEERAAPEPPKPSPIGAETVPSYVEEAPTSEAAEPMTQPAAESSVPKQEPSVDAEIAEEGEGVPEERLLDKLKVPTAEGANTVTLERKRVETKTINIGGEYFDIALYQYQNGTRAARVPRAAIEKMTDIAKQNNLKVLPRHQNAAIMAGRFLGIARAELQERAEKENYHLVDFTDTYYEICFGELPTT